MRNKYVMAAIEKPNQREHAATFVERLAIARRGLRRNLESETANVITDHEDMGFEGFLRIRTAVEYKRTTNLTI